MKGGHILSINLKMASDVMFSLPFGGPLLPQLSAPAQGDYSVSAFGSLAVRPLLAL